MLTVAEYIAQASTKGPARSGMILAIRMCVLAMGLLEINDPLTHHRKLVAIVETDRCLPDAVRLVTGCRMGNRTLKFKDWGKMAASFLDLTSGRAFRVAAREGVEPAVLCDRKELPRDEVLAQTYTTIADGKLFDWKAVVVKLLPEDIPGYHAERILCAQCGEGVGFSREIREGGRTLCRSCAGEAYWLADGQA